MLLAGGGALSFWLDRSWFRGFSRGLLWGIVGMFLAVPITAILRIVLGRIEMTRPVADLLAGHLPGS